MSKEKRYQERPEFSNYEESRERVCEIYGVDPKKAQVHHILDKWTVLTDPLFEGFDLNEPSNLYPFTDDERGRKQHTTKKDHKELHQRIGRKQYERRKKKGDEFKNWWEE